MFRTDNAPLPLFVARIGEQETLVLGTCHGLLLSIFPQPVLARLAKAQGLVKEVQSDLPMTLEDLYQNQFLTYEEDATWYQALSLEGRERLLLILQSYCRKHSIAETFNLAQVNPVWVLKWVRIANRPSITMDSQLEQQFKTQVSFLEGVERFKFLDKATFSLSELEEAVKAKEAGTYQQTYTHFLLKSSNPTYVAHAKVSKRNDLWFPKITAAIEARSTLIAVGAAHLFGPTGLLALLKQKGASLFRVNAEGVEETYELPSFSLSAQRFFPFKVELSQSEADQPKAASGPQF